MIGHPVAGVKSPELFNSRFVALGMAMRMEAVDVAPEALPGYLAAFRADRDRPGLVSTTPHKAVLATFADRLGPAAERLGVANALRRDPDGAIVGEMFDGHAFAACIRHAKLKLQTRTVAIIGFGAAGQACALAARDLCARRILVNDRDPAARDQIVRHGYVPWTPGTPGESFDMLVNAASTPVQPATALAGLGKRGSTGGMLIDLTSGSHGTPLAREAARRGHRLIDGQQFAKAQFDALWAFLLGTESHPVQP